MTIIDYPRLCGGLFFALVLRDRKQRVSAREHRKGESDNLTDQDLLMGLMKVIKPEYQEPKKDALRSKANRYKACQSIGETYVVFEDTAAMNAFDRRVRNNYQTALNAMIEFVETYLETGASDAKHLLLFKALVDLICRDQSISPEQEFYIGEHGEAVKKKNIRDLKRVCFPSFLLGVWHYAAYQDNTIGLAAYDLWWPSNGRAKREYTGDLGDDLAYPVRVYMIDKIDIEPDDDAAEGVDDDEPVSEASGSDADENEEKQGTAGNSAAPNQVMNNSQPLFVNQTGDNNIVIPNYGELTINYNR